MEYRDELSLLGAARLFVPAPSVPVAPEIRFVLGKHHKVPDSDGNCALTARADV